MPDDIAAEPQTSTSLPTAAISDVQGAKCYFSDSEYSISSNPEATGSFYSPSSTSGFSYSQSSISPNPLVNPSAYPSAYSSTFAAGTAEGMYPTSCISPTYMSPYSTGKQYTWPTPTNGYTAYSPELMQSSYPYPTAAAYSAQMRSNYPGYFPATQLASTTAQQ